MYAISFPHSSCILETRSQTVTCSETLSLSSRYRITSRKSEFWSLPTLVWLFSMMPDENFLGIPLDARKMVIHSVSCVQIANWCNPALYGSGPIVIPPLTTPKRVDWNSSVRTGCHFSRVPCLTTFCPQKRQSFWKLNFWRDRNLEGVNHNVICDFLLNISFWM